MSEWIVLTDERLTINGLVISNPDSIGFLKQVPESERDAVVSKAVEVGLFCLERGRTTQDLDYVKRQVQELLQKVEVAVGGVAGATEKALLGKIGTENGQVLAPVKSLIETSSAAARIKLDEVKNLISGELDPKSATSTLGVALSKITTLLDPKHGDSVQSSVSNAISTVADPNGTLAKTVKQCVEDSIKPLQEEIRSLSRQVSDEEAAAVALANTTAKGPQFEDRVATTLATWARVSGGQVEHVGDDNQPGDFVIDFHDEGSGEPMLRVVVEARSREKPHGRQKITQDLAPKFRFRQAHAAVHVSETAAGLAKEIGEWAEGTCDSGPWVACTYEHLSLALRYVVVEHRIRKLREARPDVDTAVIRAQSDAIRTSLGRITTIKGKVTTLIATADSIESEVSSLKREVLGAIESIEQALRQERKSPGSVSPESFASKSVVESIAI